MALRLRRVLPALIGVVVFAAAVHVLRTELGAASRHTLVRDVFGTPPRQLVAALVLTAINYAVLTGYDFLAFAYIRRRLPHGRIALTSFVAYAIANNVGWSMVSGASVRYRFYTRWGISADELTRIVFAYSVTFWIGLLLLGGVTLAASPLPVVESSRLSGWVAPAGWLLIAGSLGYVGAAFVRREPLRVRRFNLPVPSPRLAIAQLGISVIDWTLAGAVLFVLLPHASGVSFLGLLGAFLAAQLVGLASHVPGGVGVFEGLMVLMLKPFIAPGDFIPALVVYRTVYYLLPLAIALGVLVLDEGIQRRAQLARVGASLKQLAMRWWNSEIARPVTEPPDEADLRAAALVIATQTSTAPNLVFLRDKTVLFDRDRSAFVMYGIQGYSWVALGDPVGAPDSFNDLIRDFLERCRQFGGTPVFYEVGKEHLYRYVDAGLTAVKIGEHAHVDLRMFTLEGGPARRHRQAMRRLAAEGATFRVISGDEVMRRIDQLRDVSDHWLREKATAEKGFSLGFFEPGYLARFPIGVIEQRDRVVAFANLWPAAHKQELSIDLMRYHRDAPRDVMEGLLAHLMAWARAEGYQRFMLGMVPLSGVERSPVEPLWNRMGAFVYRHGEAFYNFQGLRAYKDKFDPEWEPRYLAYPGGLRLPRIVADVAALVAGGYRRILSR
jgi:lysylphosphatidylglycerol synthetase-like protein (DUF2156 family)